MHLGPGSLRARSDRSGDRQSAPWISRGSAESEQAGAISCVRGSYRATLPLRRQTRVDSGVTHSDLAPLEDLPYAPRTVEVGIYGPIGPSRAVTLYACCDIAARQLRWVDDQGEVLIEQPSATGDASLPSKPSDPYGGLGSY